VNIIDKLKIQSEITKHVMNCKFCTKLTELIYEHTLEKEGVK
jgi:hypothetical protein